MKCPCDSIPMHQSLIALWPVVMYKCNTETVLKTCTPIICHTNSPGVFGGKPGSDDGPLTPGRSTGGSPGIPG